MAGLSPIARGATTDGWLALQTVDPIAILEASRAARASATVALVLAVGGLFVWRFEPFVDRSADAALARPLRPTAYGVAAHAVVAFAGVLLSSNFAQIPIAGRNTAVLGPFLGLVVVLLVGGWGFTVVGTSILERWDVSSRWVGLLGGATIAGGIAVVAGIGWLLVVSMGIGEPVRTWLYASPVPDG